MVYVLRTKAVQWWVFTVCLVLCCAVFSAPCFARGPSVESTSELGELFGRGGPAGSAEASPLAALDLLLIPDSEQGRIMAFDADTGDLVIADFIPLDLMALEAPCQAILSAQGDTVLVSDVTAGSVHEYDISGNYLGVFAPAGGPDPDLLGSTRGIALRPNGNLLVAVGTGDNAHAIAEFDTAGNYLGNFVAPGAGGLNGPRGLVFDGTQWLVSSTGDDSVKKFHQDTGEFLGNLSAIDEFPDQLAIAANGNVLVAVAAGADDEVTELRSDGTFVATYTVSEFNGTDGVYELLNRNLLVTRSDGVYEMERGTRVVETKLAGVDARYISRVTFGAQGVVALVDGTCPGEVTLWITGGTPGGTAGILRGTGPGNETIPSGPCAGTSIDIEGASLSTVVTLDADGNLILSDSLPPSICGAAVQIVDTATCQTSNAVTLPELP